MTVKRRPVVSERTKAMHGLEQGRAKGSVKVGGCRRKARL